MLYIVAGRLLAKADKCIITYTITASRDSREVYLISNYRNISTYGLLHQD